MATGGAEAVVEVLGVALQVVPELHRRPPGPPRACPPRGPQPPQQLLHRRRRPAAAAAGVLAHQRSHPRWIDRLSRSFDRTLTA